VSTHGLLVASSSFLPLTVLLSHVVYHFHLHPLVSRFFDYSTLRYLALHTVYTVICFYYVVGRLSYSIYLRTAIPYYFDASISRFTIPPAIVAPCLRYLEVTVPTVLHYCTCTLGCTFSYLYFHCAPSRTVGLQRQILPSIIVVPVPSCYHASTRLLRYFT